MGTTITKINIEEVWRLRHQVMWPDKDFDFIKLKDDDAGIHLGLLKDDVLISVISLFITKQDVQFRKFATLEHEQGKGYGSTLLEYVIKAAKIHGLKRIWCNARTDKLNFYKKFGLQETSFHFTKEGKSYIIMEKYL